MPIMWQHLPERPSIKQTYCICSCTDYTACRLRSNDPCEYCQYLASVCSSHLYSINEALVVSFLLCGNTFWSPRPSSKHAASVHELTTIRLNPSDLYNRRGQSSQSPRSATVPSNVLNNFNVAQNVPEESWVRTSLIVSRIWNTQLCTLVPVTSENLKKNCRI